jgi:hypothetical protein
MSKTMNPALKLLFVISAFLMATQKVGAAEWRGIKPLSSMREDVVRLFGECAGENEWCEFTVDNEDVTIGFSGARSCNNLPPGTVLSVQTELRNATTFEALRVDKHKLKSFDPSLPRNMGYRGFIDERAGLLLKTFRGEVFQINYIAAKQDQQVCPAYYQNPRQFVQVFFPHVIMVSSVGCPGTSPAAGEKVVITASYPRTGQRLSLTWITTAGRILEGQNTAKILLDITALEGQTITVTVELNDGSYHTANGSCSFTVAGKRGN